MNDLSETEIRVADQIGEEIQRADAIASEMKAPWDVAEVPHTISVDERAMLCQACDGVSWPTDTAEAFMCEWLEEHGLLTVSGSGDARVWTLTSAGEALHEHINDRDKTLREECQVDFSHIVRTDEEAEAFARLARGGMPK